jgi:hypothetical protein
MTGWWPIGETREFRLLEDGEGPRDGETYEPMAPCHHTKWVRGWAVKTVETGKHEAKEMKAR